jgi:hypothetical protein
MSSFINIYQKHIFKSGATTYTEIVRRKADPRDMADIHLHSDYRTVSLY